VFTVLVLPKVIFAAETRTSSPLENPIEAKTFEQLIIAVLDAALVIGLPIAALFIIYSGFLFVTAQGSVDRIDKAKVTLTWTLVGVAIFVSARVCILPYVDFVAASLTCGTSAMSKLRLGF